MSNKQAKVEKIQHEKDEKRIVAELKKMVSDAPILAFYCQAFYDLICQMSPSSEWPLPKECHEALVRNGMTGKKEARIKQKLHACQLCKHCVMTRHPTAEPECTNPKVIGVSSPISVIKLGIDKVKGCMNRQHIGNIQNENA